MTPSADRTASAAANEATFILTNVVPQAPENNQGLWADLEAEARDLVAQGNELYIVAGGAGSLGTLAGGKLTIPAVVWKAIVVLPAGDGDDAARVTAQTQVIAIWTPNDANVAGRGWEAYRTSIRCIEQRTGFDLFAVVADEVEAAIEGTDCQEGVGERVSLPMLFGEAGSTPMTPTPVMPTPVTPTPVTPTPVTPTPAPASVTITAVEYDPPGDDVQGEYVVIRNTGGSAADLTGWTLRDLANNAFTFPSFSLAAGAEVRVRQAMTHNDGHGPVAALIAVLSESLVDLPTTATRVMAFVLDAAGRGDHLGLWLGGQPAPGGLDLLAGAISARAQPQASLLVEWTADGGERHYRGWAVWRDAGVLRWRRLSVDEARQLPDLQTGQPLGTQPLARFEE